MLPVYIEALIRPVYIEALMLLAQHKQNVINRRASDRENMSLSAIQLPASRSFATIHGNAIAVSRAEDLSAAGQS